MLKERLTHQSFLMPKRELEPRSPVSYSIAVPTAPHWMSSRYVRNHVCNDTQTFSNPSSNHILSLTGNSLITNQTIRHCSSARAALTGSRSPHLPSRGMLGLNVAPPACIIDALPLVPRSYKLHRCILLEDQQPSAGIRQ